VHIVLDDFGELGCAYRETGEGSADETNIVENILNGEYRRPLRVVAFNIAEGWARDVTHEVATRLLELSADRVLSASARDFVERPPRDGLSCIHGASLKWRMYLI
jgi:hypothetical protein